MASRFDSSALPVFQLFRKNSPVRVGYVEYRLGGFNADKVCGRKLSDFLKLLVDEQYLYKVSSKGYVLTHKGHLEKKALKDGTRQQN